MVYALKCIPSQKLIVMTGLHDRDGMKCGKVLVVEDIAETNMLCNVLFLLVTFRKPECNIHFAGIDFDSKMKWITHWDYLYYWKIFLLKRG